ncbi:hypothetical protein C943_04404 [Mariniradius saccharolyticus AK6]|uniref:SatD n=1 Tax=Mariniradius saccharolyticus AK6 TaxID=1239962 RepID=M7Y8L4_9BACT|nr:hypothetical protein [Mariniradius saccharolyticus]EMS33526.1 hypothetical protein C943_04404 [Mariniradius saccharolyticus AK6]
MIAVIKGDIIGSRNLEHPDKWLAPLKHLFADWGLTTWQWEIVWGDFFQFEITQPEEALHRALQIKALVKHVAADDPQRKSSPIDVRMAIGIGEKTYTGERISESNGPAFVYAGERFEKLKKDRVNLGIQSPSEDFDREIDLYLKLAGLFMDEWTISSAELVSMVLKRPAANQEALGNMLGIKQNSVSGRWNRAKVDELLEVELMFRHKLKQCFP